MNSCKTCIDLAKILYDLYLQNNIIYNKKNNSFSIEKCNPLFKIDRKNYTISNILDIIDNDKTKYIVLSKIKILDYSKDDIFNISDIISNFWNNVLIELENILFDKKINSIRS